MSNQHPSLAIVGIGCRFPGGVNDPDSYWDLLINHRSGIIEVPPDRWDWRKYYHPNQEVPGRMVTKWGGFVDDFDQFDARFFGISPREAQQMDIQQRWLLETSWRALEDAGLPPATLRGRRVGVFMGISSHDQIDIQRGDVTVIDVHTGTGSAMGNTANRLSYTFDFRGPSLAVDTACSSALVATHLACQSIWSGQCIMALAGGVNALLNPNVFISFSKASMLSPDGQCFAFDQRANGYVRAEGAGVVVIKPLPQAEADGDNIYAIIRAAVVNQDGHTSSLSVPNLSAQTAMLHEVYDSAGIDPSQVTYVEAHGTGTPVGDPIEAQALGQIFGAGHPQDRACLIGSVKTNIGHLEAASGIAGLIKAALILQRQTIPPQLNFEQANPNIPLTELGLQVVTDSQPLPRPDNHQSIIGVNSFGFGGTNAHVILEQAQPIKQPAPTTYQANRPYLLPLSAPDETALQTQVETYQRFLTSSSDPPANITTTAGLRREHFNHRLVIIGSDSQALRARLQNYLNGMTSGGPGLVIGQRAAEPRQPVFVFTGQGSQWWGMGQQLLAREPLFRQTVETIDELFQSLSGWSLLTELTRTEADSQIHRTDITQPAIFAVQVALAQLWAAWGIRPTKTIGHSVGEVAAAYVAGIFSLVDAVKIIYHRSRLQHTTAGQGQMAAVGLTLSEVEQAINGREAQVQVAAINSPGLITLTGEAASMQEVMTTLESSGKFVRQLPINYAFHSHQMDAIRAELLDALADIQPQAGNIPFISTVTTEMMAGQTLDADYWWHNVRQPVRFAPALTKLIEAGETTFLEIGPHPALQHSIGDCLTANNQTGHVFHSLRRDTDESLELLENLARLHNYGLPINWASVNQSDRRPVRLPGYVWQRQSYWLSSEPHRRCDLEPFVHPLLGNRLPAPQPTWEQRLDPRVLDYLNDHQIWASIMFPAAGYGEIGLAVAHQLFPNEAYVVEMLQMKKALFVSIDQLPTIRVVFDEAAKTFSIYSTTGEQKEWQLNALGQLRNLAITKTVSLDILALQQSLSFLADKESYYLSYKNLGYQFGPNFQQIQNIWSNADQALAQVKLTPTVSQQLADYHFHPALLDACFQCVSAAAGLATQSQNGTVPYLPAAFDRIRLLADQLPDNLWIWTNLIEKNEQSLIANMYLYDEQGKSVAEILGGRFDRVQQKSSAATELYQFRWEAKPLENSSQPATAQPAATYLLFADQQGVAAALGEALTQTGARVITVAPDKSYAALNSNNYTINPTAQADLRRVLAVIRAGNIPLTAVIHAWSLDHPPIDSLGGDELTTMQQTGVLHALQLAQALVAENLPQSPDIIFLSRDTLAVVEADSCTGLVNAPLIGFLRVANNEHSAFKWRLIDLDVTDSADEIDNLLWEVTQPDDELEVAYRQSQRYVNRLRQIELDTLAPWQRNAVQTDGRNLPFRLQIEQPGSLTNLSLNETSHRPPGPTEIEAQVQAGGLNFRDVMKALGLYPGSAADLTDLGDDFAGIVTAVGEQVNGLKPGDAVVGLSPNAFRSYLTVNYQAVFKIPDHLNFEEAATIPTVFLTAYYALVHLARLQPGEAVLIHAATGGVGQAAVQIAQDLGLDIFVTAGTPEKRALLKEQGLQHIFDSRSLNFADDILRVTQGRGVDAVLNSLAGDFIPKNFSVLAPFGRYLEIGKVDVYNNSKIGLEALRNNISLFIIDLAQFMEHRPDDFVAILAALQLKFEQKVYRPLPYKTFPITEAVAAFRYMAAGKHIGKNVLSFKVDEIPVGRMTEDGSLFRPEASYLITGGVSGFGLAIAQWMARQGARHLALMSRSGPPNEAARAVIAQLRADNVQILDVRGDVTQLADVERAVGNIHNNLAPLAGVIHSAMALNDQLLVDLNEADFNQAFHPKMLGAWHLHQATLDLPLEHFICFSSISSLVGTTKQANYSAGNAFLDTLASYRQAKGLPALTINWGVLSEAGFLARNQQMSSSLQMAGIKAIATATAQQTLRHLLPLAAGQIGAASINWNNLSSYLAGINANTFRDLIRRESAGQSDSTIIAQVTTASPQARLALVENFLAETVAKVLGTDTAQIDPSTSLNQLGLDSMMAIELINSLNNQLNLTLAVSDVLSSSSLQAMATLVLQKIMTLAETTPEATADPAEIWSSVLDQADTEIDLFAEAQLDPTIYPTETAQPAIRPAQAILLTGATGFLGAFLLSDLLHQTEADIYCLVRAETAQAGLERLKNNLARYTLEVTQQARIKPIVGDLAQPRLGLSAKQFQQLADQIDLIYHNGAALDLLQPYHALKATNVLSVQEILRLAAQAKIKPLHYISTIAVFFAVERGHQTVIRETDQPDPEYLRGGYMQSKWVAEQLIRQAQTRGLPCSIYRPGLISGHSQTGITNAQDLASRLVRGSYQLGLYPDRNRELNIVPVDYVSQAIVHLSQQSETMGQVFHLANPQATQLSNVVSWADEVGAALREVPYQTWRAALIEQAQQGVENDLLPLLPFFSSDRPEQLEQQVDCQNTLRYLANSGLVCPPVDASLIKTYVTYMIESGFINPNSTDAKASRSA